PAPSPVAGRCRRRPAHARFEKHVLLSVFFLPNALNYRETLAGGDGRLRAGAADSRQDRSRGQTARLAEGHQGPERSRLEVLCAFLKGARQEPSVERELTGRGIVVATDTAQEAFSCGEPPWASVPSKARNGRSFARRWARFGIKWRWRSTP